MSALTTARQAIRSEIQFLIGEQKRLSGILQQLGGASDGGTSPTAPKKRGRKSAAEKAAAGEADLNQALELIRAAGKGGVKAIRLASLLKKAGHTKVGKTELLAGDRVKVTGKRGGTTYVYTG